MEKPEQVSISIGISKFLIHQQTWHTLRCARLSGVDLVVIQYITLHAPKSVLLGIAPNLFRTMLDALSYSHPLEDRSSMDSKVRITSSLRCLCKVARNASLRHFIFQTRPASPCPPSSLIIAPSPPHSFPCPDYTAQSASSTYVAPAHTARIAPPAAPGSPLVLPSLRLLMMMIISSAHAFVSRSAMRASGGMWI
jgi:hypothetical protein